MVSVDDPLASIRDVLRRHEWQAALDAARATSFDDPGLEADRLDLEADAAWWLGRLEDCIAAREAAYRIYDERGDRRRAGQCAVWLWEHHAICARPSVASGWLRRARRALDGDTDCVEYGNLLLREAEMAHGSGEVDRACQLATTALDLGRQLRSTDLEAEALQTKGRILVDHGNVDGGMGDLDEAMLFATEGRLGPFATAKVYCSLIAACEAVGDFDRAAEWTEATPDVTDLGPGHRAVGDVALAQLLARLGSLSFGRFEGTPPLEDDGSMQPADAREDGEGVLLCPPQGRLGPLRCPVEVAHGLAGGDEAAVHLAGGEGPEPALDREEHGLVQVAHAIVDVAAVDEDAPFGL